MHAPFAQLRFDSGSLSLAAGVRHNMPSDGQAKTVWNVSGRLGVNERVYVRGQVGTSFRLPDAYELYVVDPCCEQGNPNLIGEESFNTEAGVGLEGGMFSGEVLGFYRKIDNLIDIDFSLPAYPDGFIVNTANSVTAWGGEVIVNARLSEVFGVTFDYTHTEVEASGTNQQIQDIPRDLAKLIVRAQAPSGRFGGTAAVNWVGDVYDAVAAGSAGSSTATTPWSTCRLMLSSTRPSATASACGSRTRLTPTTLRGSPACAVMLPMHSYAAANRGTPLTAHVTYRLSL